MSNGSPEKSLVKPHHRRMQSVQNGTVRGLSDSLERRSPEKGLRTSRIAEFEARAAERSPTREGSETPTPSGRATPTYLNRPILGENTPPSATMLALQSMRARAESEAPLSNITNSSSNIGRAPYTFDAISSQILSLTSIATNLQREMAALSRRSKDNATDLISLKEATNSRDEDIRKSLKDLVVNLDTKFLIAPESSRSAPPPALYLDNKAHNVTPGRKNFSLPRIPSPNSFTAAMERELTASPSIVSSDGVASIALLEKVLREMGTKDGQEKIVKILERVKSTSKESQVDPSLMTKLEEIMQLLKENSASRALIRSYESASGGEPTRQHNDSAQMARTTKELSTADNKKADENCRNSDLVNEEVMKILKRVKQSVSEGGGLTNEVKALVRELRGEVLGMGRELARKLEQVDSAQKSSRNDTHVPGREEIAQIVEEGLHQLKEHMDQLIRENRRQSAANTKTVDTQEVVLAVRGALAEIVSHRQEPVRDPAMEREEMLSAVREAWEDCKPEIALEHFGLERDEILDTLKEGLRSYQPQQPEVREVGATYEEVLDAVQKGLANFKPPPVDTDTNITREEILMSVRECLESFEFPMPILPTPSAKEPDLTRDDVVDAVKEGLNNQGHITKEIEFNRDDLFDAVKAGLEGAATPMGGVGEQVLEQMHEFLASMKTEFKQYSAANGKDTEQVLDAMKDGFEELRADIESYVDRAADVTGKDEIIDTVKHGFKGMQADIESCVDRAADVTGKDEIIDTLKDGFRGMRADIEKVSANRGGNMNTPELLDAMEKEFEHLRQSISKSITHVNASTNNAEILDAIRDLSDDRGSTLSGRGEDIARLVKEELEHMRSTLAGTLVRATSNMDREEILDTIREGLEANQSAKKVDGNESILSNTSELLDAFQEGVDGIRSDMERLMNRPVDISTSYEILDTLKAGLESVRCDIERLHNAQSDLSDTATARGREVVIHDENLISTEIEGLKVMITQLRIKVEALDLAPPVREPAHQNDIADVHTALKEIHAAVHHLADARSNPSSENVATKDDTDAIETLLRNVKAKLQELSFPDVDGLAKSTHLDSIEDLLRETKEIVDQADVHARSEHPSKEDFGLVELLLKEVVSGVEGLQDKVKILASDEDRVTKTDLQVIETLCLDTKTQLDEFTSVDFASLPNKEDFITVHNTIKTFQESIEAENELTAQAFEARKIEHGGLATKIEDVKGILSELRGELIEKLDGSEEGIVELSKVLGHHHESMSKYASAESIAELTDLVRQEFDKHHENQGKSNADAEERDAALAFKHDETKTAISSELSTKIEDKFNELIIKYDDAQLSNESKLNTLEERDGKHLEALTNTKAVVDDLKLLIDTLGSTTSDACDRISDDSKIVFNRVAEANSKLDELHQTSSHHYAITRDEIAKTMATAMRLEGSLLENQPAILAAIKEVTNIVAQHYEHSQAHYQHSQSTAEEIRSNINAFPSTIPSFLPALPPPGPLTLEVPVAKEYDDSQVHDKLNVLLNHANGAKDALCKMETQVSDAKESLANMEKLDRIHEQMLATAGEVSAMVVTQTRLMGEHHESRAMEAAEAGVALEKRVAQKEKVEAEVVALTCEKHDLVVAVEALRREKEELGAQSKRLTREVAKLETALSIRQEEMRDMDLRAEKLERRILEGVMDHARSLNMIRPVAGKKNRAAERDRAMSLKRVSSTSTTATARTAGPKDINSTASTLGNAVGMALKKRTPLSSAANSTLSSRSSGVGRRILSTSHVTGNRGRDAPIPERALMLAPVASAGNTGLVSLKRSHSVKSNPSSYYGGGRKASWNAPGMTDLSINSSADKENEILTEEEEEEGDESHGEEEGSEAGTERRSSFSGTSLMYTDSLLTYGTGSTLSRNTSSAGRSVSYASSAAGVIDGGKEGIVEEDEDEMEKTPEAEGEGEATPTASENEIEPEAEEDRDHAHHEAESNRVVALLAPLPPPPPTLSTTTGISTSSRSSSNHPQNQILALPDIHPADKPTDLILYPTPSSCVSGAGGTGHGGQQHSDSGIGSEPQTADVERLGAAAEYFTRDTKF